MAFLTARKDGRNEIRETLQTAAGSRARTLAIFRGSLAPEILDRAAERALLPFDPDALRERARQLGVTVIEGHGDAEARSLLKRLRSGGAIDPILAGLLQTELVQLEHSEVPVELREASDWLEVPPAARGRALRGLLRVSDRIVRSRPAIKSRPPANFPRFRSKKKRSS